MGRLSQNAVKTLSEHCQPRSLMKATWQCPDHTIGKGRGMTITPDRRQLIWLDDPDSGHVWELI
jgi:hypothetical protein